MAELKKALLIRADDWEGLFVDYKCVMQNHSVNAEELLKAAHDENFDYTTFTVLWMEEIWEGGYDYLIDHGCFPDNLKDMPEGDYSEWQDEPD